MAGADKLAEAVPVGFSLGQDVGVQIGEGRGHAVRYRDRLIHGVDVHVGRDGAGVLVPPEEDVVRLRRQLPGVLGRGVDFDGLLLHQRRAAPPADGVLPHAVRECGRDHQIVGDVGERLIPGGEGVRGVHRGRLDRRGDPPGGDRVDRRAVGRDGLRVEDGAVVVLEGDGVARQQLVVGDRQIGE